MLSSKVLVFVIDFDGCIGVQDRLNKNPLKTYHPELNDYMRNAAKASNADKIIIAIGSNRQHLYLSVYNDQQRENIQGTCYETYQAIADELARDNLPAKLDTTTWQDVFAGKKLGHHVELALKYKVISRREEHLLIENFIAFNENKLLLLAALAHKFASDFPDAAIDMVFVDDRFDILEAHKEYFTMHQESLPQNLNLKLVAYNGRHLNEANVIEANQTISYAISPEFIGQSSYHFDFRKYLIEAYYIVTELIKAGTFHPLMYGNERYAPQLKTALYSLIDQLNNKLSTETSNSQAENKNLTHFTPILSLQDIISALLELVCQESRTFQSGFFSKQLKIGSVAYRVPKEFNETFTAVELAYNAEDEATQYSHLLKLYDHCNETSLFPIPSKVAEIRFRIKNFLLESGIVKLSEPNPSAFVTYKPN